MSVSPTGPQPEGDHRGHRFFQIVFDVKVISGIVEGKHQASPTMTAPWGITSRGGNTAPREMVLAIRTTSISSSSVRVMLSTSGSDGLEGTFLGLLEGRRRAFDGL